MAFPDAQSAGGALSAAASARNRKTQRRIAILALMALAMVVSHYLTPATGQTRIYHDLYRRILYVPVIFAAFWFGRRGGLTAALAIGAAYFPHILHDWGGDVLTTNLNRTMEVVMYVIVGTLTGHIVDRLCAEQEKLRRANEQLTEKSRELERAMESLRDKTSEIFEAEEQLRRSDRLAALGQLTTGLAHEIRNPLASIRGAAEILGDAEVNEEQRRQFGNILVEETARLDQVLGNFLEYARAQKAEGDGACRVAPVLERVLLLLDKPMRDAGVKTEVAAPGDLPDAAIAENLLQQALLNLMLNAVQAMPEGGRLNIEARTVEGGRKIRLAVGDTGPGIAPEDAARIFDPFYTTKPQGTGLGLAIAFKVIAGRGGKLYLDEDYAAGARFVMEIPAA